MRFYTERCEAMRNFANKIWNASRFLMMNLTVETCELPEELELEDKWILSKLNSVIPEVTENMEKFELGVAAQKVYDFIWDDYCDWYIELTKARLQGEDEKAKENAQKVLCYVLTETLKLLHPFMPFITEEIWQALPHKGDYLMLQQWPEHHVTLDFPEEEKAMELIMDAIRAVRTRRAEMNVPPSKKAHLTVATLGAGGLYRRIPFLKRMAYASDVTVTGMAGRAPTGRRPPRAASPSSPTRPGCPCPWPNWWTWRRRRPVLEKELEKNRKMLSGLEGKLQNPGFVNKAPANVVEVERERAEKLRALIEKLESQLQSL